MSETTGSLYRNTSFRNGGRKAGAGDDPAEMDYYELRLCGVVKCCGTIPMLGYPPEQLRQMLRDGYRLYRNGKPVKVSEL